jgi:signal transduction histidine kinase
LAFIAGVSKFTAYNTLMPAYRCSTGSHRHTEGGAVHVKKCAHRMHPTGGRMESAMNRIPFACLSAAAVTSLLLLLFSSHAISQRTDLQSEMRHKERMTRSDTAQVGRLLAAADSLVLRIDSDARARGLIDEALRLSTRLRHTFGLARAHGLLGLYHQRRKDAASALKAYLTSYAYYEKLGDRNGMAGTLHGIGHAHAYAGASDKAVHALEQSLRQFEELGNMGRVSLVLRDLSSLHAKSGRLDSALALLARRLSMSEQLGNVNDAAGSLILIGNIHLERAAYDEAVSSYQRGLEKFEGVGNRRGMASMLNNIGHVFYRKGDLPKAREHIERAMKINEEIGNRAGLAVNVGGLGHVLNSEGRTREGVENLERALRILQELGDRGGMAKCISDIGVLLRQLGEFDRALTYYAQARVLADELNMPGLASGVLGNIGIIHTERGEYDSARLYIERSLAMNEGMKLYGEVAANLNVLASIHRFLGEFDSALAIYNRSLVLRRQQNDTPHEIEVMHNMAGVLENKGAFTQARDMYEQCISRCEKGGYQNTLPTLLLGLAEHLEKTGVYDKARDHAERARSLMESRGNRDGIALALNVIGSIQLAVGNRREARIQLERSLRMYEDLKNSRGVAGCLNDIGTLSMKEGELEAAMNAYTRSLALSREMKDRPGISECHRYLGDLHRVRGDALRAREHYEESLAMDQRMGRAPRIAQGLMRKGLELVHEGSGDLALMYLTRGLQLADSVGALSLKADARTTLGKAYAHLRDTARAFIVYRELDGIRDSLFSIEHMKAIADVNARYDSERREQRIAILEKDKAITELQMQRQDEYLRRQLLEAQQHAQQMQLLEQENDLRTLELSYEREQHARKENEVLLLKSDNMLKAAVLDRQRQMTNGATAGVVLLFIMMALGYMQVRQKRRASELRAAAAEFQAQAAEYQVRAAEAETYRMQAAHERRENEARLEFSRQLIASQEMERSRIAAELHDQLGQDLVVIRNSMLIALREGRATDVLAEATTTAGMMLENVRRMARDLRPYQLDHSGLTSALTAMVTRVEKSGDTAFTMEIDPIDGVFSKDDEITVYRIVQESINNIMRHAHASEATVRVVRSDEAVELVIEDDGRGFSGTDGVFGFGMHGMHQRVALLRGTMRIVSVPGEGTKVIVSLPLRVADVKVERSGVVGVPHD